MIFPFPQGWKLDLGYFGFHWRSWVDVGVEPKIEVVTPQIMNFNRVFHEINK